MVDQLLELSDLSLLIVSSPFRKMPEETGVNNTHP